MASVSEPTTPVSFQQDQVKVNNVAPGSVTMTSLYVGDLHSSVTEIQLRDFFAQAVGKEVKSVKVCRDHITNVSRGYGYVNCSNAQDATKAMDLLNFKPINGKPVRIMLSNRDPSIRKSGYGNIYIKDLHSTTDSEMLYDVFSLFGTILSCKVATDSNGRSKRYGYIQFDKDEAAQKAIEMMDGMVLNNSQIFVEPFICKRERDQAKRSQKRLPTLFVKNLSKALSDGFLEFLFGDYGRLADAVIVRDEFGNSRGFGFVVFEDSAAAASAIQKLNGYSHEGKVWYVGWAQTKSERQAELKLKFEQERNTRFEKLQGANLYLKNLDDSVNDEKLKELFSEFGTITSCKVMLDSQGQSKGYGFVAFSSPGDASKAVNEMNGKMIGRKPLYVAVAERKEERKARLQAHFAQVGAPVTAPVPLGMHIFHPVGPTLGPQQVYFGQGYVPGIRPAVAPKYTMPYHHLQRPDQPGQPYQQQVLPGIQTGVGPAPMYMMPHHIQGQEPCQSADFFQLAASGINATEVQ